MEPLVLHSPTVVANPNVAHIADDKLSDSCLMQSLYPRRRQLVLDVSDLVVQLPKLPLFGPDQPVTAVTSFLLPSYPRRELRLEALAIPPFGAK